MSNTMIDRERSLGTLVRDVPAYAQVFESVGIDYYCGGDVSIGNACEEIDIDIDGLRDRLADARINGNKSDWETQSGLIDDIVTTHHQYLREELPSLEELVQKVAHTHNKNHPELRAVKAEYLALAEAVKQHISEEEEHIFSVIEKYDRGDSLTDTERTTLRTGIEESEDDHEKTAACLERLAELTDNYVAPDDACSSYQMMLERLDTLERDTHLHIHKEDNILFIEADKYLNAT